MCIHLQISFKGRTFKMILANLWIIRQVHFIQVPCIIFQETIKTCAFFSVLPERTVTASNSYTLWHVYRTIIVKNKFYWIK